MTKEQLYNNSTAGSLMNSECQVALIKIRRGGGGHKRFSYRNAKLWNSLCTEVRHSSTLKAFKMKVQNEHQTLFSYFLFIHENLQFILVLYAKFLHLL